MIRTVAFDIMDTVLRDPFREALEAATGLGIAEVFARREPGVYPAFERGEIDETAYWAHYGAAGIEVDPAAFHRVRRERLAWLPGMETLLDELAGRVRRVTASNYPCWIEELAGGLLHGRFERVIASCHLGIRKPDPGFYQRLLAELSSPASAVLFVDDRPANVAAATSVGIASHRFVDEPTLRAWLVERGVAITPAR